MTVDEIPVNTIQPPEWMDEAYIAKALQKGFKAPELELIAMNIKPATNVGDNYASQIFRASVSIKKSSDDPIESKSIIIKTLPKKGKAQEMMSEWSIFKKEAAMLSKVLPKINQILKDAFPDMEPLSAECVWFSDDPEEVIIIQDLKEFGFANTDRRSGMDLNLAKIVLKALGQFHAASYLVIEREPELMEQFWESLWSSKHIKEMTDYCNVAFDSILKQAEEWDDMPADHLERLRTGKDGFMSRVMEAAKVREESVNVLQHGDCWTNNFMFRGHNGKIDGFRFVDFQLSNINSAAIDLNYFIFSSPKSEFRTEKIDEMLETYHTSFMKTVKDLNINLKHSLTLEELKKEFLDRLHFGLMAMVFVFPITVLAPNKAPDINDFLDESKSTSQIYTSDAFKIGVMKAIPYFIENGVL